jgi:hypothetical protein
MFEQPDMFSGAAPERAPAQRHSPTSQAAAKSIEPRLGEMQRVVLAFLKDRGVQGATDEEMQQGLAMNPSSQRPRRIELLRKGLIRKSYAKRQTLAGRDAVVWLAGSFTP